MAADSSKEAILTSRTIEIGLLWHSLRSGNHGVNALTVSNMALAREAAESLGLTPRFTFFAPGDPLASSVVGDDIAVMAINRRNLVTSRAYWDAVGGLDCMLDISAGDSFADIYSAKRFGWMWLTKRVAIARGVPLILSPQTIGPFTRQPYRTMAGAIMRRAELTVARDPLSYEVIGELAPGRSGCSRRTSRSACLIRSGRRRRTGRSTSASTYPACCGRRATGAATPIACRSIMRR